MKKIIAYVKDERFDLNIMTPTLKSIINCDILGLIEIFKVVVLAMHFLRLVNMLQLMKKFARV
jgi:hypothetical protein